MRWDAPGEMKGLSTKAQRNEQAQFGKGICKCPKTKMTKLGSESASVNQLCGKSRLEKGVNIGVNFKSGASWLLDTRISET